MKVHVNKFNHRSLNNLSICSTGLQILYTWYIDASHPFGMLRKIKILRKRVPFSRIFLKMTTTNAKIKAWTNRSNKCIIQLEYSSKIRIQRIKVQSYTLHSDHLIYKQDIFIISRYGIQSFWKNTWLETYISWSIFVLYNTLQCNIKAALVQKRKPFKNHGNKIEHPLSVSCNFVEACFQFHTCTCINYIF